MGTAVGIGQPGAQIGDDILRCPPSPATDIETRERRVGLTAHTEDLRGLRDGGLRADAVPARCDDEPCDVESSASIEVIVFATESDRAVGRGPTGDDDGDDQAGIR